MSLSMSGSSTDHLAVARALADHTLVSGRVVVVYAVALAAAVVVALVIARRRPRRLVLVAAGCVAVAAGAVALAGHWFRPASTGIATADVVVFALGAFAVVVSASVALGGRGRRRAFAVVAVVAAGVGLVGLVDVSFAPAPSIASVVHDRVGPPPVSTVDGLPAAQRWLRRPDASGAVAPRGVGPDALVAHVDIPGVRSDFAARAATVYFPPAYLASPRPELGVVVLVAGQPGRPDDWFDSGRLGTTLDAFAAAHDGLAPVVVVPDALGADDAETLCVDSPRGNVATYLDVDVPEWIASHLQVSRDHHRWAVGGFSFGGTCAVQSALGAPDVYPTFLDFSGQDEPSLGTRQQTVDEVFDGDEAAFEEIDPRTIMATHPVPSVAGVFVGGADDAEFGPQTRRMYEAARDAGMDVRWYELPGGHSGAVWGTAFARELPWLSDRLGVVPL